MEGGFHGIPSVTPINPEVFFKTYWPQQVAQTLCMDLKLCMYNHLEALKSLKQFRGILNVFMTSSMADFYNILQFLATAGVTKCVECVI